MAKKKTSKKMGRPPKPVDEKQSERVVARFTKEQMNALKSQADKAGLPVATYLAKCWIEKDGE